MPNHLDTEGVVTMNINWKPIHTQMVMDKATGLTIDKIAQKYGYSYFAVANVLRNKRAKDILRNIDNCVLKEGIEALPEKIKQMKLLAFQHVEKFLQDENKFAETSPFKFFDKAIKAMEVLEKVDNPILNAVPTANNQNIQLNIFNNPEQLSTLNSGLDRALEVAKNYEHLLSENFDESETDFERARSRRKDSERARSREDKIIKKQG